MKDKLIKKQRRDECVHIYKSIDRRTLEKEKTSVTKGKDHSNMS